MEAWVESRPAPGETPPARLARQPLGAASGAKAGAAVRSVAILEA